MNQRKSVPYSVAITDICVNGKSVVQSVVGDGGKSEISLEASQKNVTFTFLISVIRHLLLCHTNIN